MEIRDALAELAVEAGTFALMNDRQKQELYESLVISTLLAKVGYEQGKTSGDMAVMTAYRTMAGQNLTTITGLPPEKINFTADINATMNPARHLCRIQNLWTLTPSRTSRIFSRSSHCSASEENDNHGRPRRQLGTGGASITTYFNSGNYSSTDTSFFGEKYTIRSDGTYTSKFQGRASNTTIRESDSGNILLSGGLIIVQGKKKPTMRYQFVSYMSQPNGAAVLTLIFIGENPPLDVEALRASCGHAHGYITCLNSEEWVRIP